MKPLLLATIGAVLLVGGRGQGLFSRIGLISWCDNVLNGYFHESNNHRRRAWHSADAHHG